MAEQNLLKILISICNKLVKHDLQYEIAPSPQIKQKYLRQCEKCAIIILQRLEVGRPTLWRSKMVTTHAGVANFSFTNVEFVVTNY